MIDPYSMKRPVAKEEARTFEENGETLALTFRERNDFTRQVLGADKYSLYVRRYITGEPVTGEDGVTRLETSTLRAVDGVIPAVSESLCDLIATLETMQVPTDSQPMLAFDQWAALGLVMPGTMTKVQSWAVAIESKKVEAKNDFGEAAAP